MRHSVVAAASAVVLSLAFAAPAASAQQLAPPPPLTPPQVGQTSTTSSAETTAKLDEAERKDSGRDFELFWVDGKVGASYINMAQFSSSSFQIENASSAGPMVDLGAGLRFLLLVVGARARYNALSSFNMWQLNGEVGLRTPMGPLDFQLGVHGGYSFVGKLSDAKAATNSSTPTSSDKVSIRGWNAGLELGFDYYVTPAFSIGLGGLADFLLLNRPPVEKPAGFALLPASEQAKIENDPLYKASGTSVGLAVAGGLRLGLHLGL